MPDWPLTLRPAGPADQHVIVSLIDGAASWLRTKGTDQWARPWPSEAARNKRIFAALQQGKTWIGWDGEQPAATLTADLDGNPYWTGKQRGEPAVYVHRLVVSRPYAGAGLGAELLDWAGAVARRIHGARWIRVSVWTTNLSLHSYYRRHGFAPCGCHPDDRYPSAARFQKPTSDIRAWSPRLFRVECPPTQGETGLVTAIVALPKTVEPS
jgi:GNAT superfamily N-acetyltransferase